MATKPFWLIAEHRSGQMNVLAANAGYGKVLPIFSSKEDAELFLRLEVSGTGWRAKKATAGELVSVLCELCTGVEKVVLDPPPEILGEAAVCLVSLSWEDFVRTLVDKGDNLRDREVFFEKKTRPLASHPLRKLEGGRECYRRC